MNYPLADVEDKAVKAKPGEAASIRALTDEVLNDSPFSSSAASVRGRLYQAELAYRVSGHAGVLENDLAKAVDRLAAALQVPGYSATTVDQVRVFRMLFLRYVPVLFGSRHVPHGQVLTPEMSPAGGVCLVFHLLQQKLLNRDYRVPAAQWIQRITAPPPASAAYTARSLHVASDAEKTPADCLLLYERLTVQSGNESGPVVRALHQALDGIGIAR